MSFNAYTIKDMQWLVDLAISKRLKRLKVADIEIEPDYTLLDRAAKHEEDEKAIAESLAAQEIAARLMDVTDDQLLDDPFVGLPEAFAAVDNKPKPEASKEGLTDE